jgi:hypothetical protein
VGDRWRNYFAESIWFCFVALFVTRPTRLPRGGTDFIASNRLFVNDTPMAHYRGYYLLTKINLRGAETRKKTQAPSGWRPDGALRSLIRIVEPALIAEVNRRELARPGNHLLAVL